MKCLAGKNTTQCPWPGFEPGPLSRSGGERSCHEAIALPPTNRERLFSAQLLFPFFDRYLEHEHYRFCVPSNFSSGFASLPLAHVWVDGVENTSWPTNTRLSTGDKLDGKKTYAMILPYFTTNDMTPIQVQDVGKEQLAKLYPLVSTMLLSLKSRPPL